MNVFQIKCADFVIEINCIHDGIKKRCEKYLTESSTSDIVLSPEKRHFDTARKFMPNDTPEEVEFAAIFCLLHEKLTEKHACCIHAAVISVDGEGYAFSAKSGVGKTTHVNLWKKLLRERCEIINGDKPILTLSGGKALASGSPWCGKEGWSKNATVPLKAVCFLERSEKPSIRKLTSGEIIDRLFYQLSLPPKGGEPLQKCLQTANLLIKAVPFYLLKCDISEEAAKIAYEEMSK